MVKRAVFLVALVVTVCGLGKGEEFISQEGCPEGREPNEQWTEHTETGCRLCDCKDPMMDCEDCEEVFTEPDAMPDCYIKEHQEKGADFPKCCLVKKRICRGDQDFNEDELSTYLDNTLVEIQK